MFECLKVFMIQSGEYDWQIYKKKNHTHTLNTNSIEFSSKLHTIKQ